MKKGSRLFAGITGVLTAALVLTGCGKKEEVPGTSPESSKGSFAEQTVEFPPEWDDLTVKQLFVVEEELHLLTAREDGDALRLREWTYRDETFEDVTKEWLSSVSLPAQDWMNLELMEDGTGAQYLFAGFVEEGDSSYKAHLWREENGHAANITPEAWTEPNELWGGYEYIQGIAALKDGTLAAVSYTTLYQVDGRDGTVLTSENISGNYGETLFSDGENLYLTVTGSDGITTALEKRPGGKPEGAEKIELDKKSAYGLYLCATKDGTLICAGEDGILRYRTGEKEWKKLLAGIETEFAMTESWCTDIAALEDGRIFALFSGEDDRILLKKYEFDPDAVTQTTEVLKLFTVEESYLLQNAATLYHREHPGVLIEIECAFTREDLYSGKSPDYNEIYQQLNTRLMGDEAPDLLVLDGLNIESYERKGLLADLEEVISPLEKSGELLSGITSSYVRENGKRYIVPLEFGFPIVMGRGFAAENVASLEALASFLERETEPYLGPQTVTELVDLFYPYFCGEIVRDGALDKDALEKNMAYLKTIADSCGIVASHSDQDGVGGYAYTMWDLPSRTKLVIAQSKGFKSSMVQMAIVDYAKGDFAAFENCFIPFWQIGVCEKSAYKDTAKDFIRFALSEAVLGTDYYSGYPVNAASLEKQAKEDRSGSTMETAIEASDGGMEVFTINAYSYETARKLTGLCRELNRPVKEDAKIREVLIESLAGYLTGDKSAEAAIEAIEGGLSMYLAE